MRRYCIDRLGVTDRVKSIAFLHDVPAVGSAKWRRMQLVVCSAHILQVDDLPQAGGIPVEVLDCFRKDAPLDAKLSEIALGLYSHTMIGESVPLERAFRLPQSDTLMLLRSLYSLHREY